MRILYESLLFDVTRPGRARGPGHVIHQVLRRPGVELRVLGPPTPAAWRLETLVRKLYRRLTGRRYLRFPLTQVARASTALNSAVRVFRPEVVVTMFPVALASYRERVPVVYRVDATYRAMVRDYPEYGYDALMTALASRFQARACRRSARLVTHSDWCRSSLVDDYGIPNDRIQVFANASGLPRDAVPTQWDPEAVTLRPPLRLLFVGSDRQRKGLDIAVGVVHRLNAAGIEAQLTVCGLRGEPAPHVRFAGIFDLDVPREMEEYTGLYRQSHLLLMPTRFDTWAMVTSEAAAFGVPTLTNDVAGMSASVLDHETGLVLPRASPPEAYADAVARLLETPELFQQLRQGARRHYDRAMSWDRFGDNLMATLEEAARNHGSL